MPETPKFIFGIYCGNPGHDSGHLWWTLGASLGALLFPGIIRRIKKGDHATKAVVGVVQVRKCNHQNLVHCKFK